MDDLSDKPEMTRAGKFGGAVGEAAAKGLLWSVNRLFRALAILLGLHLYASLVVATVPAVTRPSPLLVDATVSDLMWGMLTPIIVSILAWRLLTDD